jgi:hypothetical protein
MRMGQDPDGSMPDFEQQLPMRYLTAVTAPLGSAGALVTSSPIGPRLLQMTSIPRRIRQPTTLAPRTPQESPRMAKGVTKMLTKFITFTRGFHFLPKNHRRSPTYRPNS